MISEERFYWEYYRGFINVSDFNRLNETDRQMLLSEYKKLKNIKSIASYETSVKRNILIEIFEENHPEYLI